MLFFYDVMVSENDVLAWGSAVSLRWVALKFDCRF